MLACFKSSASGKYACNRSRWLVVYMSYVLLNEQKCKINNKRYTSSGSNNPTCDDAFFTGLKRKHTRALCTVRTATVNLNLSYNKGHPALKISKKNRVSIR